MARPRREPMVHAERCEVTKASLHFLRAAEAALLDLPEQRAAAMLFAAMGLHCLAKADSGDKGYTLAMETLQAVKAGGER